MISSPPVSQFEVFEKVNRREGQYCIFTFISPGNELKKVCYYSRIVSKDSKDVKGILKEISIDDKKTQFFNLVSPRKYNDQQRAQQTASAAGSWNGGGPIMSLMNQLKLRLSVSEIAAVECASKQENVRNRETLAKERAEAAVTRAISSNLSFNAASKLDEWRLMTGACGFEWQNPRKVNLFEHFRDAFSLPQCP